jgi:hypothetical protein
MHRRHFIGVGGAAAALFGALASEAEAAPQPAIQKSVADFGVEPNVDRDQTAAMQHAIDELASSGQLVFIPAGNYRVANLRLPSKSAVLGATGLSVFTGLHGAPVFEFKNAIDVSIRSVSFAGAAVVARECRNLTVADCRVMSSGGDGLVCSGTGLFVTGNRADACAGAALWVEGDGMVTNNMIGGAGRFGIRLGGAWRLGTVSVINNRIEGTEVGVGVSSSDIGYAFIAMNMISGVKSGGIRALSGNELIGKDLTRGGSEAFRNLAIAANVSV